MALCSDSVLTGQEGLIQFKPPGTSVCVRDDCPFTGTRIYLECGANYKVNDCVQFTEEDGGNLDSALVAGDMYYVVAVGVGGQDDMDSCGVSMNGTPYIEVSATQNGTAITFNKNGGVATGGGELFGTMTPANGGSGYTDGIYNDVELTTTGSGVDAEATVTVAGGAVTTMTITKGGSGFSVGNAVQVDLPNGGGVDAVFAVTATNLRTAYENSDLPAHININICAFQTVCQVRSFSIDLSRDELDVTTLPCSQETSCNTLASFRKTQAGFATATGELEVYFTCDQESLSQRLLGSSLLKSQQGATVRLFLCTNYDGDEIDLDDSLYLEAEINLLGMSFSVNPDDPSTATINFGVTKMISVFGQTA